MGLSNELFSEAGSFSCHVNPHKFFQPEVLRLYFPMLEPSVARSVSLPSCSSWFMQRDCPLHQPPPHLVHQLPPRRESSPPRLPVSTPPIGLDEYFFFNSLVVGLPCGSIFCHFWLFFVFKLLLSFFWSCEEAQCVYLRLHLGRKSPVFLWWAGGQI